MTEILGKSNLAQTAFGTVFGSRFGAIFVAVCLFFFAFSTVLSWNLYGKINVIYLFGRENAKRSTAVYTVIALVFIFCRNDDVQRSRLGAHGPFQQSHGAPERARALRPHGTVAAIARNKTKAQL